MSIPLVPPTPPPWLGRFFELLGLVIPGHIACEKAKLALQSDRKLDGCGPLKQWFAHVRAAVLPEEESEMFEASASAVEEALRGGSATAGVSDRLDNAITAVRRAAATVLHGRGEEAIWLAYLGTLYRIDQKSQTALVGLTDGTEYGIDEHLMRRLAESAADEGLLHRSRGGFYRITELGRRWYEEHLEDGSAPATEATPSTAALAASEIMDTAEVIQHLSFMTNSGLRDIATKLLEEIGAAYSVGANLAAMVLCGSAVETMVLDVAEQLAGKLQFATKPNWADSTSLPRIIAELHGIGLLAQTTQGLLVADHRDLVHANRRRKARIRVDAKNARAMMTLVEIVAHDLHDAAHDGRLAALKR
jgi:hypothetical protein